MFPINLLHKTPALSGSSKHRRSLGSFRVFAIPTTPAKMNVAPAPTLCPSTTTAPLIPDKIMPELYISDLHTARAVLSPNYPAPNRPRIRYVLSLLERPDKQPRVSADRQADFVFKLIVIRDGLDDNLLQHLREACDFIKSGLANKDGGILVHCYKGVSRSGAVATAFVMQEMGLDFEAALLHVRRGRPQIKPNSGFQSQLQLWARLQFNTRNADGSEKEEYVAWIKGLKNQIETCGQQLEGMSLSKP